MRNRKRLRFITFSMVATSPDRAALRNHPPAPAINCNMLGHQVDIARAAGRERLDGILFADVTGVHSVRPTIASAMRLPKGRGTLREKPLPGRRLRLDKTLPGGAFRRSAAAETSEGRHVGQL